MTLVALILLFGAAGASARYLVGLAQNAYGSRLLHWPIGTLGVNVVASFAVGVLAGSTGDASLALEVGAMGALSTWSTVALEVKLRIEADQRLTAGAYLATSIVAATLAALAGLEVA